MSRLVISPRHLYAVEQHARAAYPHECCGILLGSPLEGAEGVLVEKVLPARNERRDRPGDRYSIEPRALLAAHKEARSRGLEVVGYYHSHPDHPAAPSAHDRERAWAGVSYLIASVNGSEAVSCRSWRLAEGGSGFAEEEIVAPAGLTAPWGQDRKEETLR